VPIIPGAESVRTDGFRSASPLTQAGKTMPYRDSSPT